MAIGRDWPPLAARRLGGEWWRSGSCRGGADAELARALGRVRKNLKPRDCIMAVGAMKSKTVCTGLIGQWAMKLRRVTISFGIFLAAAALPARPQSLSPEGLSRDPLAAPAGAPAEAAAAGADSPAAASQTNQARAAFTVSTFAGTGERGYWGDGGPATKAKLDNPFGIARGPDDALYVCDMGNQRIRRIALDGTITTVAGSGRRGYSGDGGPATAAELNEPYEVRFDARGNMYFVEMQNHLVRRVDRATGVISTV